MNAGDRVTFTDLGLGNEPHSGTTGTLTVCKWGEYAVTFNDGKTVWAMEKEMSAA